MTRANLLYFAIIAIYICLNNQLLSQQTTEQGQMHICGTELIHQQQLKNKPDFAKTYHQKNQQLAEASMNYYNQASHTKANNAGDEYFIDFLTVPVVVHLVHDNNDGLGQGANLTDEQVEKAIAYLNRAYGNQGYFDQTAGVDLNIQFALASRTPNGGETTGIKRWSLPSFTEIDIATTQQDSIMKAVTGWDRLHYLNIWVVNEIIHSGISQPTSPAGYSFIGAIQGKNEDGVVCEAGFFGTDRDSSKVVIHEVGHYFNLEHPFKGGCTNNDCLLEGDFVCDTPPKATVSRKPCAETSNTCLTDDDDTHVYNPLRPKSMGGQGDQNDLIENYMDYSFFTCQNNFTLGQRERMHISTNVLRPDLFKSRGVLSNVSRDATIIDIVTPANFACNNSLTPTVTLANYGTSTLNSVTINYRIDNGATYMHTWTGALAQGESVNVVLPTGNALNNGNHSIYVYTSNPNGLTDQKTANDDLSKNFMYLPAQNIPFTEEFSSNSLSSNRWVVNDPDQETSWGVANLTSCASEHGTRAAFMNYYNYPTSLGQPDFLFTRLNLGATSNALLTFDVSYLPFNATFADRLKVVVSVDCGETYQTIYDKLSYDLATVPSGGQNSEYQPLSCSDWRTESVSLANYTGEQIVLGFVGLGRYGNNLYIDNIRVAGSSYTPCLAPNNIYFTDIGETQARTNWLKVDNADSYKIQYREKGSSNIISRSSFNDWFQITDLIVNRAYEVRVSSVCSNEESAYSAWYEFTTVQAPCLAPSYINANQITHNEATISWPAVENALYYALEYRRQNSGAWNLEATTSPNKELKGLSSGKNYEVRVQTFCDINVNSPFTNTILFTTESVCAAPANVVVELASHQSAILAWDTNEKAISYVAEYRPLDSNDWQSKTSSQTNVVLNNLMEGTTYYFRVKAQCSNGSSAYNSGTLFSTSFYCLPPSSVSVSSITEKSAMVNWTTGQDAEGYNLRYKDVSNIEWIQISNLGGNANGYILNDLTSGTIYQVAVESICQGENSGFSSVTTFNTVSVCDKPYNIVIDDIENDKAHVCWDASTSATSFRIDYRRSWPDPESHWRHKSPLEQCVTLGNLQASSNYEIRIKSICAVVGNTDSGFGEIMTFTTTGNACAWPTSLQAEVQETNALLNWEHEEQAAQYNLRFRVQGADNWEERLGIIASNFLLDNLLPATTYEFEVQAICEQGISQYSEQQVFTTLTAPVQYCSSYAISSDKEYIRSVSFGKGGHSSGPNGGYADFTEKEMRIRTGLDYDFVVEISIPKGSSFTRKRYCRAWVDFNQDGDWSAEELIMETTVGGSGQMFGQVNVNPLRAKQNIHIPENALLGTTLMRVSMKHDTYAQACEIFADGEVEDYSVKITAGTKKTNLLEDIEQEALSIFAYPNPAKDFLHIQYDFAKTNELNNRLTSMIFNAQGQQIHQQTTNSSVASGKISLAIRHFPKGVYFVQLNDGVQQAVQRFVIIE